MSQDLEQNIEQSAVHLQQLLGVISSTTEKFDEVAESLASVKDTPIEVQHDLDEFDSAMKELLAQALDAARGAVTEFIGEKETSIGVVRACTERVQSVAGELDDHIRMESEEILQAKGFLLEKTDDAMGDIEAHSTLLAAFEAKVQHSEQTVKEVVEKLTGAATSEANSLTEHSSTFNAAIEGFTAHLCDSVTVESGNAIETLVSWATETATADVSEWIDRSLQDAATTGEDLTNELRALADGLTDLIDDIVTNLGSRITEQASNQINELFDTVLCSAQQSFAGELLQSGVVVEIGSATTSALSPVLMQLVAAKNILSAINSALDALEKLSNPFG